MGEQITEQIHTISTFLRIFMIQATGCTSTNQFDKAKTHNCFDHPVQSSYNGYTVVAKTNCINLISFFVKTIFNKADKPYDLNIASVQLELLEILTRTIILERLVKNLNFMVKKHYHFH